jgi:hypothetical protein
MREISPCISLDVKEDGIMTALVRLSWLRSRKSLMKTNGNMMVENHGLSDDKESHSGLDS